jgi:hypothetical protein
MDIAGIQHVIVERTAHAVEPMWCADDGASGVPANATTGGLDWV